MTVIKHMKLLTLALPLMALTLVAPAKAEKMGLYVSGAAGFTMTAEKTMTAVGTALADSGAVIKKGNVIAATGAETSDKAPRFFGAIGYHIGDSARVELEFAYGSVGGEVKTAQTKPTAVNYVSKHKKTNMVGMLNAYYDLMPGSQIRPYVLGGVGYAKVTTKPDDAGEAETSTTALAYQAGAGVSYALNDSMSVFADYRFRSILVDKEATTNGIKETADSNFNSHAGNVGLRFGF